MKNKTFRIISTVAALGISSLVVYALSHAGNSSRGPIENAMTYAGNIVDHVEHTLIMESRPQKRSDKLMWLRPYTHNKALLFHPGRILLGAFDNDTRESFESIISLEDTLHTTFPLIHIYAAWGSKPEEKFPADQVKDIIELGSIPVITWEPWLNDFSDEDYPGPTNPADRNKSGMRDVASGKYDSYITKWASDLKKVSSPVFLRLGHEMNDGYRYPWGPQNNTPLEFIAAWKHVHDIFVAKRVKNVIWVWSPHPAYEFRPFYPGDAYVDYVGSGVLNYGTVASWSKWWSFADIFGKYYDSLATYKKPIMITEFGSLAVGGNRARWYADALDSIPHKYPLVRSLLFFHFSKDNTTTQQTLNWYFKYDKPVVHAISREIGKWK